MIHVAHYKVIERVAVPSYRLNILKVDYVPYIDSAD